MNAAEYASSSYAVKPSCSQGAKVGMRHKLNDTALSIAASRTYSKMTPYLLEKRRDVNAFGHRGGALCRAVEPDSIDNMKVLLLEYKINVNQESRTLDR